MPAKPRHRPRSCCMQFVQSSRRPPPGCDEPRPKGDPLPQVSRQAPREQSCDQAQRAPDDRGPHGPRDSRLRPRAVRQPPEPADRGLGGVLRPLAPAPDEARREEARPRGGPEHPNGVTPRDPTGVRGGTHLRAERARRRADRPEAAGDALAQLLDRRLPRPGPHPYDRSLGHRSTVEAGALSARRTRRGRPGRARRRSPGPGPAGRPATRSGSPSSSRRPRPPRT
jgi:hypothetical protein